MKLLDDIHLEKSLSEDSLTSEFEGVNLMTKKGKRSAVDREVESEDLFDFSKAI